VSDITQLPTRAEFIRDRLADWLTDGGWTLLEGEMETFDGWPTLFASGLAQDVYLYVTDEGKFFDADTDQRLRYRFTWLPEPTDTGVMHGPRRPIALFHERHRARELANAVYGTFELGPQGFVVYAHFSLGALGSDHHGHVVAYEVADDGRDYSVRLLDGEIDAFRSYELTWNPSECPTDTGVMHGPAEDLMGALRRSFDRVPAARVPGTTRTV
jgi:hypothetical protein